MNMLLDLIWNTIPHAAWLIVLVCTLCLVAAWRIFLTAPGYVSIPLLFVGFLFRLFGLQDGFGTRAVAIAQRMPTNHPALARFRRARAERDLKALITWAREQDEPVTSEQILLPSSVLSSTPKSAEFDQLLAAVKRGYVSRHDFDATVAYVVAHR